jgi:hypothetical protein
MRVTHLTIQTSRFEREQPANDSLAASNPERA